MIIIISSGLSSNPEPGRTSLSLTDVHVESFGSNLETWSSPGVYINSSAVAPAETMWYHDTGGDQVERKHYQITGINNNGSDGTNNRITMDYSFIYSNILNNVANSKTYYITSGVVINDYYDEPEYAWVSQETVTSASDVTTVTSYDLIMTTNLDSGVTKFMKPSETFFFVATIVSTNPATNLEFEISEFLGDDDSLHFGRPHVTFGSAFRFTKSWPSDSFMQEGGRLHHLDEKLTNSGLSVRKRRWRLVGVLNAEATRDPASDDNKIIVTVPITLVDLKTSSGASFYPENMEHRFTASISSYPEERFYPVNAYSYNEMASFIGTIKRSAGTPQLSASGGDPFLLYVSNASEYLVSHILVSE